jgi:hypothetical protein
MFSAKRLSCLLLALVLGLCSLSLAAHPVSHPNSGAGQCVICASHAGLEDIAVPAQPGLPLLEGADASPLGATKGLSTTAPTFPQRQRAPPVHA